MMMSLALNSPVDFLVIHEIKENEPLSMSPPSMILPCESNTVSERNSSEAVPSCCETSPVLIVNLLGRTS